MDDCGSHIWHSLPDDHFVVRNDWYTVLSARCQADVDDAFYLERETIIKDSLRDWAQKAALAHNNTIEAATFQCLIISTHDFNDYPIDIARDDLLYVASTLGIPSIQAQLLFAPYTGYVGFDRKVQWYSGRPGLRAIASTDPSTGRTFAIVTINESEQVGFEENLRQLSGIADHPLMLALAIRMQTLKMARDLSQKLIISLRDAEQLSGFHAGYEEAQDEEPSSLESRQVQALDLGKLSRKAASDASNLGNYKIILARLVSIQDMLQPVSGKRKWQEYFNGSLSQTYATKSEDLVEIDAVFESMRQSLLEAVAEYQDRARNLQSVLFNLIAKEDANASMQLAEDSRTIAVATKKDGESMKTIAIMTMIFLPGTFFSSLFAMPTLLWDQSPVIQSKFWVYWAFTIPSTIFILAAWYLLGLAKSEQGKHSMSPVCDSGSPPRRRIFGLSDLLLRLSARQSTHAGERQSDRVSTRTRDVIERKSYADSTMVKIEKQSSYHSQDQHPVQSKNDHRDVVHTQRSDTDRLTADDMA